MPDSKYHDLIILGAGPAGMTAGVYAARKQLDTLILSENVGGQTTWSSGIENYPGFLFISGPELVFKFEEHLRNFDVRVEFTKAASVTKVDGVFSIDTEDGRNYVARAVVVASGKSPRMLNVPGEREFTGRGVTYCATCDGPLFSGRDVAVIGGGNSGLDAAVQLMKICPKVYVIEVLSGLRGDEVIQDKICAADNVEVFKDTAVREIRGDTFVTEIVVQNLKTQNTTNLQVSGVFIEVGLIPNTAFIKDLVQLNKDGEIPVDCSARTEVPGLFAAGDCTMVAEKQIIIAAGDGAKAALGAYSYLVRQSTPADWGMRVADL